MSSGFSVSALHNFSIANLGHLVLESYDTINPLLLCTSKVDLMFCESVVLAAKVNLLSLEVQLLSQATDAAAAMHFAATVSFKSDLISTQN